MKNQTKGIICIVLSAFCFSVMNICVRAAGDLPSIEKNFFRNLVAAVIALVTLPYLIFSFESMTAKQFLIMLGAGLAAAGGQFSITKAYYYAPAREISVYDYSQIIFSAVLGFTFFGQMPDRYSIIGYIIICAMAVMMFLYNRKEDMKNA